MPKKINETVLSKPMSREEYEKKLGEKKAGQLKVFRISAVGIAFVLAVFLIFKFTPVGNWAAGLFTIKPDVVINQYINAVNSRNEDRVIQCLSPQMKESTESRIAEESASGSTFFSSVFSDDLIAAFGKDVSFSVENIKAVDIAIDSDNLFYTDDDIEKYKIEKASEVTCDLITKGSLDTQSNKTKFYCIFIDGKWYIDYLVDVTDNGTVATDENGNVITPSDASVASK